MSLVLNTSQENQASTANPCPNCGGQPYIVMEREPSPHYAHRRCRDCQVFLGWVPKPETLKRQENQRKTIERLLNSAHLTDWEQSFCQGLIARKKLSPKQAETLARILAQKGGAE